MNKTKERLQTIFREVFEDESLVVSDDMSAGDVPNWDSMAHINMIIAVEFEFKIKFATAEISQMKKSGQTVGRFLALLDKKLEEKNRRPA